LAAHAGLDGLAGRALLLGEGRGGEGRDGRCDGDPAHVCGLLLLQRLTCDAEGRASALPSTTVRKDAVEVPAQPSPSRAFFMSSAPSFGWPLPAVRFIPGPTSQPRVADLPERYVATCSPLAAITAATASWSAPESETWASPSRST